MDAVGRAFAAVPRAGFLRRGDRWRASVDGPIAIGLGQTNSQPRTVADMLRLLDVGVGHRVLDVGAGSGWTTALLAHLVGPEGEVVGVELEPELVRWGAGNLGRTGQPWATIRRADPGVLGCPALAPYDRILVSAMARVLPEALVAQLVEDPADPGLMVIPVDGEMLLLERIGPAPRVTRHGHYRFVPLR